MQSKLEYTTTRQRDLLISTYQERPQLFELGLTTSIYQLLCTFATSVLQIIARYVGYCN